MANLKTKEEAEFVLKLKDGREFWEGMEVERKVVGAWEKNIISDCVSPKTITLGIVLDHPCYVRIPQPPPEKTPLERMREVDRIINADRSVWSDTRSRYNRIGGDISFYDRTVKLNGIEINYIEILLDSGEWKNLKEVVG